MNNLYLLKKKSKKKKKITIKRYSHLLKNMYVIYINP